MNGVKSGVLHIVLIKCYN